MPWREVLYRDVRAGVSMASIRHITHTALHRLARLLPFRKTTMPDPWSRIIKYWRRCKIPIRPGVRPDLIAAFEARYEVVVPVDVREYFTTVDGTGDEMDDGLYRFWPLAEVKPVHEELADTEHFRYPDRYAYPDCFVFADHCISCWDYAVKLTHDPSQPAPVFRVTGGKPPGEIMASSFREFMAEYADDPANII